MTRRTLLGATGAALYAQTVSLPRKVRVAMIGLVGHPNEITRPLDRLPDVEVVAIAERDSALIERFKKNNSRIAAAKAYTDARRMLDTEKLDVVAVCNTQGERAAAIIECAQRKLNVIAEKPAAITRADLDRVKKAVRDAEIKFGMLLNMRYAAPYLALKQIASSGDLGEIIQISSQKSYQLGQRPEWFKKQETYGSTILWIGIHMIDLMRWTSARKYTHASAFMGRVGFPDVGEMETTSTTSFRLDNGGTATLHMDYCLPAAAPAHGDDRLRLAGTKGVAEYMAATGVTLVTSTSKPMKMPLPQTTRSVFLDFIEHAYNGKPATLPHEEIWAANDATMAAHEAAVHGKVVTV